MIPRILHPMAKRDPPLLKDELPAHLPEIPTTEHLPSRTKFLDNTLQHDTQNTPLHVLRFHSAERKRHSHAELMVELARGVCVDGVGAGGLADVHGYEFGLATAYYYYFGGWGEGGEEGGGNGGGEGAEVFLAVLYTH